MWLYTKTYVCAFLFVTRDVFQELALPSSQTSLAASDRLIALYLKLEVQRKIKKRRWVRGYQEGAIKGTLEPAFIIWGSWERLIPTEIHQFQSPLTLNAMNGLQKLGGFIVEFNKLTPRVGVEKAEEDAGKVERLQVWTWPHTSKVSHQIKRQGARTTSRCCLSPDLWSSQLSQESLLGHTLTKDTEKGEMGETLGLPESQVTQRWHRQQTVHEARSTSQATTLEALSILSPELDNFTR